MLSIIIICSYRLISVFMLFNFTSSKNSSNALDRYHQCNAGNCIEQTVALCQGLLSVLPFEE